jgi:NAD(P)-dependent dehydrogenase (short-subunit alcohol dehydrogenase family)
MKMIDFSGQQVLVVGGTSGIGFATAKIATSLGAKVTVASRSQEKIEAAIGKLGRSASGKVLDVTNDAGVETFFSDGALYDHIIVTGSDVRIAAVRELPLTAAQASFDSKFWGFYRIAKAARIKPGGSLEVIAGFLATRPAAGRALMGAINGAIESLVQGLALELKPVRVNAVSPAMVDTEMWAGMSSETREATFAKLRQIYPAGVIGRPEDIARQLLLLAATPYATGTIVTLDGGASIA